MTNTENLKRFIKENKLTFEDGSRNSNCTIICGYSLWKGYTIDDIENAIDKSVTTAELLNELDRVWRFSNLKNYGNWWKDEKNRKSYII